MADNNCSDDSTDSVNTAETNVKTARAPVNVVSTGGYGWGAGDGVFNDETYEEVTSILSNARGMLDTGERLEFFSEGYMAECRMTYFSNWADTEIASKRLSDLPERLSEAADVYDVTVYVTQSPRDVFNELRDAYDGEEQTIDDIETIARQATRAEQYHAAIRLLDDETLEMYEDALADVVGDGPFGVSHPSGTATIPSKLWGSLVVQVEFNVDAEEDYLA